MPEDKLRLYLMSPDHSTGTNKFRVFQSALGVGTEDWEYVRDQFLAGVRNATPTDSRRSVGCTVYSVPMMVRGLNGAEKRVMTAWKVPDSGGPPTLVTAYVQSEGGS